MDSTAKTISTPKYYFKNEQGKSTIKSTSSSILFVAENKIKEASKGISYYDEYQSIGSKCTGISVTKKRMIDVHISMENSVSTIMGIERSIITNGYNEQTLRYVSAINEKQRFFTQRNEEFLSIKYGSDNNLSATALRNKNDWLGVKRLVVRDELMKLQIGETTDLPLSESDILNLRKQISGKDLSNFNDNDLLQLIDKIIKPDESVCLEVFINFKETGATSPYFQQGKLLELKEHLNSLDLNKITRSELKKLMDNYWEKLEIHHRTSISKNPSLQSDIDNLSTLNTSRHDNKHRDPETGKINYRRPLKEKMLDRQGELEKLNKDRVRNNELTGLGITLAIAAGTGFAIGFIMNLAQTGISPECIKNAFVAGGTASAESSAMALVGYGISKTVSGKLCESITEVIVSKMGENIAVETVKNISKMCAMGIVGTLTIVVSTVYQFVKLKMSGFSTKESLIRAGKSAAVSLGMLALSIIAQGIWGGPAGIIVSITSGIIVTGVSIGCISGNKKLRKKIHLYLIESSYPKRFEMGCTSGQGYVVI